MCVCVCVCVCVGGGGCVPDKLFAHRAEGGLGEEGGAELMTFDHMDFGLFNGPASMVQGKEALSLPLAIPVCLAVTCSI